MPYATQTDVQIEAGGASKLVDLTDQESTGAVNTAVFAKAQANAESWMHGFLNDRFTTPITPTTADGAATLNRISAQETVYQLILMSPMRAVGESDKLKRDQREAELKGFSDGERRPMDPSPAPSSVVPAGIFVHDGPNSRCGWRGTW